MASMARSDQGQWLIGVLLALVALAGCSGSADVNLPRTGGSSLDTSRCSDDTGCPSEAGAGAAESAGDGGLDCADDDAVIGLELGGASPSCKPRDAGSNQGKKKGKRD